MDVTSSGGRIGNALSEALGLVGQSPERVAQDQLRQIDASAGRPRSGSADPSLSASRLAAAARAGEAGEVRPRGCFLNLKV
ncbi:hypothetical protein SAMN06265365_13149 [Tistlia consotensis]|uniref:Uncharacterized protein n=1 Tax=Tistlia consotensis USBA 355 TaxID=560819 RepID=A0A1Y6CL68_9PROT|nr:hypothetical protein [Tistlia consotensis]SMF74841.1 hypothetical protein SAMN05428998_13349 [Tistlia consotensis USBA 355]SNS11191.1 hypothetical protein SAMN06265365_13149 [Tistlia consotensis]